MGEHLTHGWEADTPVSDSLLRQFIEGTAERNEYLATRTGGRTTRIDGVALADSASPVMFENTATLLTPCDFLDRSKVVRAIDDFFAPTTTAVVFSAFPTWDLSDDGFVLMGHPPFMVRPQGANPPPAVPGLEIRPVDSADEMAVFARAIADGYPMPGAELSAMARNTEYDGPLRLFNAYFNGKVVATGGTWNSHGINDVGFISALPETRRKGIGAAITYASTVAWPDDPAVLIASDDGVRVYENLGYLRLLRLTLWLRPPKS